MVQHSVRRKAVTAGIAAALVLLLGLTAFDREYPAASIDGIVHTHYFSILGWEVDHLLRYGPTGHVDAGRDMLSIEQQISTVTNFFSLRADKRAMPKANQIPPDEITAVAPDVGRIIVRQIEAVLRQQGLATNFGPVRLLMPPLSFSMTELPNLLVVSPRDKIEIFDTVLLDPSLTETQITELEGEVEKLGLSAEIERVGGVALYPSMVPLDESLQQTLSTIAHEWLHQYFLFHPLGRAYWASADMTLVNETVAELAGEEIGTLVYQTYYGRVAPVQPTPTSSPGTFSFNGEMRAIRLQVDAMLEQGRVTEAEAYMQDRSKYLEQHGYYIRRLNQAYFAFHGNYGDDPSSVSPLREKVYELRSRTATTGDFVKIMAGVSKASDVDRLLQVK